MYLVIYRIKIMSREYNKLSDRQIKEAKPKDKDYVLTDGGGLQLNIRANNSKRWEHIYKSPVTLKRRKFPLGTYPTITLKTARVLRDENINLIRRGICPIEDKRTKAKEIKNQEESNFKLITDKWLEYEKNRIALNTFKKKKAIIVNDAYPFFEDKSINDITHKDIMNVINIRLKKTISKTSSNEKQNTGVETANKLFNYLDTIFKYAITMGVCKYNPFQDILKNMIIPESKVKHQPKLTKLDEVKKLVKDIYNYKGHYSTINSLKFCLHIPLRAENLVNLKWEYIDFEEKSLTIPRKLMKTKNHNLPDFKVPLTNEVLDILKEQEDLTSYQEYVFLSNKGKPLEKNTPNNALVRMGYKGKQTQHGLRGTFRSIVETNLAEINVSEKIVERFLDHNETKGQVIAYTHQASYFEQFKPLVIWWSNYLESLNK